MPERFRRRFRREDQRRRIVACAEAMSASDGRSLEAAGIVLVRQMPPSAKVFVTLEEETGVANPVVWPKVFGGSRRVLVHPARW